MNKWFGYKRKTNKANIPLMVTKREHRQANVRENKVFGQKI